MWPWPQVVEQSLQLVYVARWQSIGQSTLVLHTRTAVPGLQAAPPKALIWSMARRLTCVPLLVPDGALAPARPATHGTVDRAVVEVAVLRLGGGRAGSALLDLRVGNGASAALGATTAVVCTRVPVGPVTNTAVLVARVRVACPLRIDVVLRARVAAVGLLAGDAAGLLLGAAVDRKSVV